MISLLKNKKVTYTFLVCLLSFEAFSQSNIYPTTESPTIYGYSPGLTLQRNTNNGGYTQGIQTKLQNGDNNWFFGNLGDTQWMVAKGDYQYPKFVVSSNGNVGVGNDAPAHKLTVSGNISSITSANEGGALFLENSLKTASDVAYRWAMYNMTGSYGNSLQFWVYNQANTVYAPRFTIADNGNVGIGTTLPSERLELQGKLKINNGFSEPNNESGFRLKFYDNGGVNNDAGLGLSGSGEGSEVMWLNAKAGFRFINGTDGDRLNILANGNVGIGTTTPTEKLSVNGKIRAKEIKVETANWPDYVFADTYQVPSINEVEKYIKTNNHLPGIPTATELEKNGIELGEMLKLQQKKIEELTLYIIELNKKNIQQEARLKKLEIKQLKKK